MKFAKLISGVALAAIALTLQARETQRLEKDWKLIDGDVTFDVTIPHTWNAIDGADGGPNGHGDSASDQVGYWRGAKTYTRELDIKPREGKRYFLRFEGAATVTDVEFNGMKLGRHEGAFGAFCFELTPQVKEKNNKLKVTVDNSFNIDIPPLSGDFTVFGGLYRPVTLIETDDLCIFPANKFATPGVSLVQKSLSDAKGVLAVEVDISGKFRDNVTVDFTVKDGKDKKVLTKTVPMKYANAATPERYLVASELEVTNPILWNGRENPHLYSITATVRIDGSKVDEVTQRWGFRTIELDTARGFVLNGKPMKIRGVNRHQDWEHKGWALTDAEHEKDFQLMYDMGITGWRAAHYPHASKMYDLCDEHGIVVWAEIPVVDRVTGSKAFLASAKFQMEEMINQHRNHPAIFVWGTANEIGNGSEGRKTKAEDAVKVMEELIKVSKKVDPTRYVGITFNNAGRKENPLHDLVGQNIYPGWYGGGPKGMKGTIDSLIKRFPKHPIAINEYGAGASIATHEYPAKQPKTVSPWHPEEWQTYCHQENYRCIKNSAPQMWGSFIWNMFDFGADHRREGDHMGRNDKGLVTYDRKTCKDVYFFYKANWTTEPMVHVTSRRFLERKVDKMDVKVFSNCEKVTLFVNDVEIGTQTPDEISVVDFKDVQFKPGKNTVKAVGFRKNTLKNVTDSYEFNVVK